MPADLLPTVSGNKAYETKNINIHIWTPDENIKNPVVIDPMTGDVFEPEISINEEGLNIKDCIKLSNVPLKDYPMIATDRDAIKDMIEAI
jgi:hypothetical protein